MFEFFRAQVQEMIIPLCVSFFIILNFSLCKSDDGDVINEGCICGKPNAVISRIVGGKMTRPNEYPWMAGIFYDGEMFCGGSLINEKYVLTAGHCLKWSEASKLSVILGLHGRNLADMKETGVFAEIDKVILHEGFESLDIYDVNDIGLLKLKKPVKYNENISPVCLPTKADETYASKKVKVTGWGKVSEKGQPSQFLKEADLKVISNKLCKKTPLVGKRITDDMLCTYMSGVDSCQGDSGGPLIYETRTGKVEQIGVVSWGIGCARRGLPGVFTRLTSYMDWIAKNTQDVKYCKIPP